ncbi:ubiquitin thioesterase ZRANB1-like [Styela clava]|uniref:ubiquitin thioesterase ZRANB1-like n=1 Tax=Styela clava TaxID=7725 RepID=UPI00193A2B52|nr:ubiquitin thioesterase ZRANB1-like [Styela clava]
MSKSIKWTCGLCTYENYPASLNCVMCCQQCPTPLIDEPRSSTDVITNYPTEQNSVIQRTSLQGLDPAVISHGCSVNADNYYDTFTREFESKARITNADEMPSFSSNYNVPVDGAGAASASLSDNQAANIADKNNEINKKWICTSCTYNNWDRSAKCVMCHYPKLAASDRIIENPIQPIHEDEHKSLILNRPKQIVRDEITQDKPRSVNSKTCSSQPGACGRLCRSYSSNHAFRCQDSMSPTLTNTRALHRHKKSFSEENLNNIMNAQDSASCQRAEKKGRHFSNEGVSNTWKHEEAIGHLEKFTKTREHEHRSWKKSNKRLNLLFLKACIGILEDNIEAVDRYLAYGGNIARPLTADEVRILNRPSAFDVGHTIVHLAVRFQRRNILALILTPEVTKRNLKRSPAILCPEIADHIRHEILQSIRMMKGDFHCQYFCDYLTFLLPIEIAGLPSSIQRLLFDELLDKDVQKELEDEFAINWCADADRLYALWNRSAGDCLLDSVLQSTWGVFDRDNVLRRAMAETMQECSPYFYTRWKEWEVMQARLLNFSLSERQYLQDWAFILSLARQPGASLEHCHIFVLSHVLRRPIIVYGVKYLKSFQGDTLGFAKFQGVYLPFLWERSFCWKSPIALGYTRGHFTALVPMENDSRDAYSSRTLDSCSEPALCTYLPLMDCERKLLPIHFTSPNQGQSETEQECILFDWLDCVVTNSGVLVAKQKPGKRPPLVTRMLDQWLDHYRHLSFRRLGEDGDTEDEE